MSALTYEELLEQAAKLDPPEQRRLLEALTVLVERPVAQEPRHRLTDLIGLGKEVWRDEETGELIDAQEYVNRERDSWGG